MPTGSLSHHDNKSAAEPVTTGASHITNVAMVCVAAVALGSSTYAWFVSNTEVTATTSTISAQSDSAFMYIRDENETSTDLSTDTSSVGSTALLPAHWVLPSEVTAGGIYSTATAARFYTASALRASAATMDTETLELVGTAGTASEAVNGNYAVANTFYVGTKGGATLTNLEVTKSAITSGDGNVEFDDALRVLVTCGSSWVLCDKNSILGSSNGNILADTVGTSDNETTVVIYVFYDGDETNIKTDNISNLIAASKAITVTLTAK